MGHAGAGLVRIARDCWIEPARADDLAARCSAVLESCPPDAVISSTTAARLHGLWLPRLPADIHVATATPDRAGRAMTRTRREPFVAHRLRLAESDVETVEGVVVTSLARTWRDLAGILPLADLVAAGDSALRSGTTLDDLADVVQRTSRARFSTVARAALPMLDARSRSRPESHLRVAAGRSLATRFAVNEPVFRDGGGWLAEPDLSLPEVRVALEYQGSDHATLARMRRDITRERDLRQEGWLCLLYGPAEVFGRPWTIGPEIERIVSARAPHLLPPSRRRVPRVGS